VVYRGHFDRRVPRRRKCRKGVDACAKFLGSALVLGLYLPGKLIMAS
jgi:hypothetical protein